MKEWSLITNHGLVLAAISRNSNETIRQIGDDVGITERTAYGIVVDLERSYLFPDIWLLNFYGDFLAVAFKLSKMNLRERRNGDAG